MSFLFTLDGNESRKEALLPRPIAAHHVHEDMRPSFYLPATDPPRKRRRGGKVYSGCGTCRARKIKCDNRQPHCWNCERSRRYDCDGYDGVEPRLASSPSVFSVMDDVLAADDNDFGEPDLGWAEFDTNLLDQPQMSHASRPYRQAMTESPFRILQGMDAPVLQDVNSAAPLLNALSGDTANGSKMPLATLNLAALPTDIRELLDHYRSHVCGLMMPTTAPSRNPWLHLYLPLALQGPPASPNEALLYGILSVSAYNRANLTPEKREGLQKQGKEYSEKAAATLRSVLQSGAWTFDLEQHAESSHALMAAALTLTTIEVFSGSSKGDWHRHLRMCKQVIDMTGGISKWLSNPTCLTLLQIFRCLQIVGSTSDRSMDTTELLLDDELDQRQQQQHLQSSTAAQSDSESSSNMSFDREVSLSVCTRAAYPLDVTFGVSLKTLRCLTRINDLSRFESSHPQGESWPDEQLGSLRTLESDIFGAFDDPGMFASHSSSGQSGLEGVSDCVADFIQENHLWAFHYATAIFFRRAIFSGGEPSPSKFSNPGGSSSETKTNRPSGQYLVSKTLEYLENIDAVSREVGVANTLWPGFIAAVEAVHIELRHRALVWLSRAKSHGIGNISQAMSLVMEVWRRVDRLIFRRHGGQDVGGQKIGMDFELASVDWREVMRERNMFIMLT
ncbi:fungal specific transcription factor domain-containing protein [Sarocladium implicatum]|nr:fungal specific transcription factor domain-containing protein [Sarocladium implicatum]